MNAYNNEEKEYRADIDEEVNEAVAAVAPEYASAMPIAPEPIVNPSFNYANAFAAAAAEEQEEEEEEAEEEAALSGWNSVLPLIGNSEAAAVAQATMDA